MVTRYNPGLSASFAPCLHNDEVDGGQVKASSERWKVQIVVEKVVGGSDILLGYIAPTMPGKDK